MPTCSPSPGPPKPGRAVRSSFRSRDGRHSCCRSDSACGLWALVALAVVAAAQFMFVVDALIVNVAIPSIRADLHPPVRSRSGDRRLQLTYATTGITGGRPGDIAGRRRVFVGGVLAFTAASLWCGLAGPGLKLVLARMAQRVTAAMMVPQVLATIHTMFPGARRPRAVAVFGVALGAGGGRLRPWRLARYPGPVRGGLAERVPRQPVACRRHRARRTPGDAGGCPATLHTAQPARCCRPVPRARLPDRPGDHRART